MARRMVFTVLIAAAFVLAGSARPAQCGLGVGLHYLRTVGDIKDSPGFDENSVGLIGSFQKSAVGLFKVEGDLEWIPEFGGTSHDLIQPELYGLLGRMVYGGAGIGIGYFNDSWQDEPFYALRAGFAPSLGPLALDVFATYRFQNTKVLQNATSDDLDSATFGVIVRF